MNEFTNTIDVVGEQALMTSIIDRSIAEIKDNYVTSIGAYAFYGCSKLTTADFPAATSIGAYAFYGCSKLTTADFPAATSIDTYAFYGCSKLTTADFPAVTSIGAYAFENCSALTDVDFPLVTNIGIDAFYHCRALTIASFSSTVEVFPYAFEDCNRLTALILRSETICTLKNTNAFSKCYHILGTKNSTYNPNGDKDGYIYVPSALIDSYKAAANWSTYAAQFRALEDYTVDGTTTGELDPNKI